MNALTDGLVKKFTHPSYFFIYRYYMIKYKNSVMGEVFLHFPAHDKV